MFHRILIDEWQHVLTIASFAIFFSVFVLTLLRIRRMPSQRIARLENLPLENDTHE